VKFGKFYERYFESGIPRSQYPLHSASYQVLEHVADDKALETAIRADAVEPGFRQGIPIAPGLIGAIA
jgi:hypothetical protein